jgi:hypothetical protein
MLLFSSACLVAIASASAVAGQTPAPAGAAAPAPPGPQTTLAPGLRPVPDYRDTVVDPPAPKIPEGFTSLFNGKDLSGWHISKTARHGVHPDFHVAHGMILGTQNPLGGGGLLITDRKFRNFEFSMEVKPDWGNDSGFFFRTTENGAAYQVTLDFLPGGSMGRMISEGGIQLGARAGGAAGAAAGAARGTTAPAAGRAQGAAAAAPRPPDPGMAAWKHEDWNTVRIRVEGEAPHVTVWINGQQISDATDTVNSAVGGMVEGPLAIQIHGGGVRWQPGGFWRWRNLAVKELP